MSFKSVELVMINFPGNKFKGEIIPELSNLVDKGVIRIIDLIFAIKDKKGNVQIAEVADLDNEVAEMFEPIMPNNDVGFLTKDDATQLAETLDNNSSAGIMLFENSWIKDLDKAVSRADGNIVLDERVNKEVVDVLMNE